jgi:hypothetical protein
VGTVTVPTNEAFSRVKIDAQIRDQGWDVENPNAVRFEYVLPDATNPMEELQAGIRSLCMSVHQGTTSSDRSIWSIKMARFTL